MSQNKVRTFDEMVQAAQNKFNISQQRNAQKAARMQVSPIERPNPTVHTSSPIIPTPLSDNNLKPENLSPTYGDTNPFSAFVSRATQKAVDGLATGGAMLTSSFEYFSTPEHTATTQITNQYSGLGLGMRDLRSSPEQKQKDKKALEKADEVSLKIQNKHLNYIRNVNIPFTDTSIKEWKEWNNKNMGQNDLNVRYQIEDAIKNSTSEVDAFKRVGTILLSNPIYTSKMTAESLVTVAATTAVTRNPALAASLLGFSDVVNEQADKNDGVYTSKTLGTGATVGAVTGLLTSGAGRIPYTTDALATKLVQGGSAAAVPSSTATLANKALKVGVGMGLEGVGEIAEEWISQAGSNYIEGKNITHGFGATAAQAGIMGVTGNTMLLSANAATDPQTRAAIHNQANKAVKTFADFSKPTETKDALKALDTINSTNASNEEKSSATEMYSASIQDVQSHLAELQQSMDAATNDADRQKLQKKYDEYYQNSLALIDKKDTEYLSSLSQEQIEDYIYQSISQVNVDVASAWRSRATQLSALARETAQASSNITVNTNTNQPTLVGIMGVKSRGDTGTVSSNDHFDISIFDNGNGKGTRYKKSVNPQQYLDRLQLADGTSLKSLLDSKTYVPASTQVFGASRDGGKRLHSGIDFDARIYGGQAQGQLFSNPAYAIKSIERRNYDHTGYGHNLIIHYTDGVSIRIGHMNDKETGDIISSWNNANRSALMPVGGGAYRSMTNNGNGLLVTTPADDGLGKYNTGGYLNDGNGKGNYSAAAKKVGKTYYQYQQANESELGNIPNKYRQNTGNPNSARLHKDAVSGLTTMITAMEKDGVGGLKVVSAFRSYDSQAAIINRKRNSGKTDAQIYAYSAPVGYSRHHTALAVDFAVGNGAMEGFEKTKQFKWLQANAGKYGWELFYNKDRAKAEGTPYEAWEWTYVGTDRARQLATPVGAGVYASNHTSSQAVQTNQPKYSNNGYQKSSRTTIGNPNSVFFIGDSIAATLTQGSGTDVTNLDGWMVNANGKHHAVKSSNFKSRGIYAQAAGGTTPGGVEFHLKTAAPFLKGETIVLSPGASNATAYDANGISQENKQAIINQLTILQQAGVKNVIVLGVHENFQGSAVKGAKQYKGLGTRINAWLQEQTAKFGFTWGGAGRGGKDNIHGSYDSVKQYRSAGAVFTKASGSSSTSVQAGQTTFTHSDVIKANTTPYVYDSKKTAKANAIGIAGNWNQGNISGLSDGMTRRYVASIILRESGGGKLNIAETTSGGFLGKYQMGASALASAGYINMSKLNAAKGKQSEWDFAKSGRAKAFLQNPANWNNGLSYDKFMNSHELQDAAFKKMTEQNYAYLNKKGAFKGKSELEIAGLLKVAHLSGAGGAMSFLKGQIRKDAVGSDTAKYYNDIVNNADGLGGNIITANTNNTGGGSGSYTADTGFTTSGDAQANVDNYLRDAHYQEQFDDLNNQNQELQDTINSQQEQLDAQSKTQQEQQAKIDELTQAQEQAQAQAQAQEAQAVVDNPAAELSAEELTAIQAKNYSEIVRYAEALSDETITSMVETGVISQEQAQSLRELSKAKQSIAELNDLGGTAHNIVKGLKGKDKESSHRGLEEYMTVLKAAIQTQSDKLLPSYSSDIQRFATSHINKFTAANEALKLTKQDKKQRHVVRKADSLEWIIQDGHLSNGQRKQLGAINIHDSPQTTKLVQQLGKEVAAIDSVHRSYQSVMTGQPLDTAIDWQGLLPTDFTVKQPNAFDRQQNQQITQVPFNENIIPINTGTGTGTGSKPVHTSTPASTPTSKLELSSNYQVGTSTLEDYSQNHNNSDTVPVWLGYGNTKNNTHSSISSMIHGSGKVKNDDGIFETKGDSLVITDEQGNITGFKPGIFAKATNIRGGKPDADGNNYVIYHDGTKEGKLAAQVEEANRYVDYIKAAVSNNENFRQALASLSQLDNIKLYSTWNKPNMINAEPYVLGKVLDALKGVNLNTTNTTTLKEVMLKALDGMGSMTKEGVFDPNIKRQSPTAIQLQNPGAYEAKQYTANDLVQKPDGFDFNKVNLADFKNYLHDNQHFGVNNAYRPQDIGKGHFLAEDGAIQEVTYNPDGTASFGPIDHTHPSKKINDEGYDENFIHDKQGDDDTGIDAWSLGITDDDGAGTGSTGSTDTGNDGNNNNNNSTGNNTGNNTGNDTGNSSSKGKGKGKDKGKARTQVPVTSKASRKVTKADTDKPSQEDAESIQEDEVMDNTSLAHYTANVDKTKLSEKDKLSLGLIDYFAKINPKLKLDTTGNKIKDEDKNKDTIYIGSDVKADKLISTIAKRVVNSQLELAVKKLDGLKDMDTNALKAYIQEKQQGIKDISTDGHERIKLEQDVAVAKLAMDLDAIKDRLYQYPKGSAINVLNLGLNSLKLGNSARGQLYIKLESILQDRSSMLTDLIRDDKLVKLLQNTSMTNKTGKLISLYHKLLDSIATFFGLKDHDQTALHKLLNSVAQASKIAEYEHDGKIAYSDKAKLKVFKQTVDESAELNKPILPSRAFNDSKGGSDKVSVDDVRHVLLTYFKQSSTKQKPLTSIEGFTGKLITQTSAVLEHLGLPEPNQAQQEQLLDYADFYQTFSGHVREVFNPKASQQYRNEALANYFGNADGDVEQAMIEAITYTAYDWLIVNGGKQLNTADDIKFLLSIPEENYDYVHLTREMYQTLAYAGNVLSWEAHRTGKRVMQSLNIKTKDRSPELESRLEIALGNWVFAAMQSAGLVHYQEIKTSVINNFTKQLLGQDVDPNQESGYGLIRYVSVTDNTGKQKNERIDEITQANKGTTGYLAKVFGGVTGVKRPLEHKPKPGVLIRSIKRTTAKMTDYQAKLIDKAQQEAFRVDMTLYEAHKALSDNYNDDYLHMIGASVTDAELERLHINDRDSALSAAQGVLREWENAQDAIAGITPYKGKVLFWDYVRSAINTRMHLNNNLINPQNSKLVRSFVSPENFTQTVKTKPLDSALAKLAEKEQTIKEADLSRDELNILGFIRAIGERAEGSKKFITNYYESNTKEGLAVSQGATVDKLPSYVFVPAFMAFMEQEEITASFDAVRNILDNQSLTQAHVNSIARAVKAMGMGAESYSALVSWVIFIDAKAENKPFTTAMNSGSDGLNNGAALAHIWNGAADADLLIRTGFYSKATNYDNYQATRSDATIGDYYTGFNNAATAHIKASIETAQLEVTEEYRGQLIEYYERSSHFDNSDPMYRRADIENHVNGIMVRNNDRLTILNGLSNLNKSWQTRDVAKSLLVPFNYGAGIKSLGWAVYNRFMDDVKDKFNDIAQKDRALKETYDVSSDEYKAKRAELGVEFNKVLYTLQGMSYYATTPGYFTNINKNPLGNKSITDVYVNTSTTDKNGVEVISTVKLHADMDLTLLSEVWFDNATMKRIKLTYDDTFGAYLSKSLKEYESTYIEMTRINKELLTANAGLYMNLYNDVVSNAKEVVINELTTNYEKLGYDPKDARVAAERELAYTGFSKEQKEKYITPFVDKFIPKVHTFYSLQNNEDKGKLNLITTTEKLIADESGMTVDNFFLAIQGGLHNSTFKASIKKEIVDSAVLLVNSAQTQSIDSAISAHTVSTGKYINFNVHDSNSSRLDNAQAMTRLQNEWTYKVLAQYHGAFESFSSLYNTIQALEQDWTELGITDTKLAQQFKQRILESSEFRQAINVLYTNSNQVRTIESRKLEVLTELNHLHQYAGEFGSYTVTSEDKKLALESYNKVESKLNDMQPKIKGLVDKYKIKIKHILSDDKIANSSKELNLKVDVTRKHTSDSQVLNNETHHRLSAIASQGAKVTLTSYDTSANYEKAKATYRKIFINDTDIRNVDESLMHYILEMENSDATYVSVNLLNKDSVTITSTFNDLRMLKKIANALKKPLFIYYADLNAWVQDGMATPYSISIASIIKPSLAKNSYITAFPSTEAYNTTAIAELIENLGKPVDYEHNPLRLDNDYSIPFTAITNYSGGAYGGDTYWDLIGREYGVTNHIHFRPGVHKMVRVSQSLSDKNVKSEVVNYAALNAARVSVYALLGKDSNPDTIPGALHARNYYQVLNASSVFAVAPLIPNFNEVTGGTKTAVSLGIALGRDVHVWDTSTQKWYEYSYDINRFVESKQTPILPGHFAGVGTRDIQEYTTYSSDGSQSQSDYLGDAVANAAIQAINEVYMKTMDAKNVHYTAKEFNANWFKTSSDSKGRGNNSKGSGQGSSNNGYEPYPEVDLNEGQLKAVEEIMAFINDPYRITHSLIGSAGSGKTTTLKSILNRLRNTKGIQVILTTPTHRANSVVRQNMPNEKIATLDSLLGTKIVGGVRIDDDVLREVQIPENGIIIVDESSMMSDYHFNTLVQDAQQANTKILFVGDDAQLSPVGGKNLSKALTSAEKVSQLTTVMRAKNNELLNESVHVRGNAPSGTRHKNVIPFTGNTSLNENLEGVAFTQDANAWSNKLISLFKSNEFKENMLLTRAVAYTNKRVTDLNATIRKGIFGTQVQPYEVGDILMGYNNQGLLGKEESRWGGDSIIANSLDYQVLGVKEGKSSFTTKVGNQERKHTLKGHYLTINDVMLPRQKPVTIFVPSEITDALKAHYAMMYDALEAYNNTTDSKRRNFHLNEYRRLEGMVGHIYLHQDVYHPTVKKYSKPVIAKEKTFDYGYAHTIHKSQGGTYKHIFVDDNNIAQAEGYLKDNMADTVNRLRYVGISRAESTAFILSKNAKSSDDANKAYSTTVSQGQHEPETINIWSAQDNGYQGLSNLAPRPFTGKDGRHYYSVEHAYQTWKTGKFKKTIYENPVWKKAYGVVQDKVGVDKLIKDNDIKMKSMMRESFLANPEAKELLLSTGNATLTHIQAKGYWKKRFPELLMELRAEFRQADQGQGNSSNAKKYSEVTESIYNSLDKTKTATGNVVIRSGSLGKRGAEYAKANNLVFSLRLTGTDEHYGNPFTNVNHLAVRGGLELVDSVQDAVKSYIDWVLSETTDINPQQHAWIRDNLKSGKLKGKKILYYAELNEPSHANALDYLINKHNWGNKSGKSNQNNQGSFTFESEYTFTEFKGIMTQFIKNNGIYKSKTPQVDLFETLSGLTAAHNRDLKIKEVASIDGNANAYGMFNLGTNTITLKHFNEYPSGAKPLAYVTTVNHEFMHSLTERAIQNPNEKTKKHLDELKGMMDAVIKRYGDGANQSQNLQDVMRNILATKKADTNRGMGEYAGLSEFVAYGASHKPLAEFIDSTQSIKVATEANDHSLFQKFLNLVAQVWKLAAGRYKHFVNTVGSLIKEDIKLQANNTDTSTDTGTNTSGSNSSEPKDGSYRFSEVLEETHKQTINEVFESFIDPNVSDEWSGHLNKVWHSVYHSSYTSASAEDQATIDDTFHSILADVPAGLFGMSDKEMYSFAAISAVLEYASQAEDVKKSTAYTELLKLNTQMLERFAHESDLFLDYDTVDDDTKFFYHNQFKFLFGQDNAKTVIRLAAMAIASEKFAKQTKQALTSKKVEYDNWFDKLMQLWYKLSFAIRRGFVGADNTTDAYNRLATKLMAIDAHARLNHISRLDQAWHLIYTKPMDMANKLVHSSIVGTAKATSAGLHLVGKKYQPAKGVAVNIDEYLDVYKAYHQGYYYSKDDNTVTDMRKALEEGFSEGILQNAISPNANEVLPEKDPEGFKENWINKGKEFSQSMIAESKQIAQEMLVSGGRRTAQVIERLTRLTNNAAQERQNRKKAMLKQLESLWSNSELITTDLKESLTKVIVRPDVQTLLRNHHEEQALKLITDYKARDKRIDELSDELQRIVTKPEQYNLMDRRSHGLGYYLATETTPQDLVKSVEMIAASAGTPWVTGLDKIHPDVLNIVDELTTLYALNYVDGKDMAAFRQLLKTEEDAVIKLMRKHKDMVALSKEEFKDNPLSYNKGYVPVITNSNIDIKFATAEEIQQYREEGYELVLDSPLPQDSLDRTEPRYLMRHSNYAYIRRISGSVDLKDSHAKGYEVYNWTEHGLELSRAVDEQRHRVLQAAKKHTRHSYDPSKDAGSNLIMRLGVDGAYIGTGYEMTGRMRDLVLQRDLSIDQILATIDAELYTKPRIEEYQKANAKAIYDDFKDKATGYHSSKLAKKNFIKLDYESTDPEIQEVLRMMPYTMRSSLEAYFGKGKPIYIRAAIFNSVFAYKDYSFAQMFDKAAGERNVLEKMITHLYKLIYKGDKGKAKSAAHTSYMVWNWFVKQSKGNIVIKSITVLVNNILANMLALLLNGLTPAQVAKETFTIWRDAKAYKDLQAQKYDLEFQISVNPHDKVLLNKLRAKLKGVNTQLEQSSLHEFMQEGILSTITDDVNFGSETKLFKRDFEKKVESVVERVPQTARNIVKAIWMHEDTPMYKALAEATQLSDFVAKVSLARHVKKEQMKLGVPAKVAFDEGIRQAQEMFINYDLPTTRRMHILNELGLAFFTKFMFRIQAPLLKQLGHNTGHVLAQNFLAQNILGIAGVLQPLGLGLHFLGLGPVTLIPAIGMLPWFWFI